MDRGLQGREILIYGASVSEKPNQHILDRLSGVQPYLMAAYESGKSLSRNNKGFERELFLNNFLQEILPPLYRVGSGEITDRNGIISGQLDTVVEYPYLPSFPLLNIDKPRLYLADSVAVVLEIKSDMTRQWPEIIETSNKLKALNRATDFHKTASTIGFSNSSPPPSTSREKIPLIAIGFKGWKSKGLRREQLVRKLVESGADAILLIDSSTYIARPDGELSFSIAKGCFAFWSFLSQLHEATKYIEQTSIRLSDYIDDQASLFDEC